MKDLPEIPGVKNLEEFGRSTLVVGYKGEAEGIATIAEVLLADDQENRREFHRSSAVQSRMAHPGMPPIQRSGLTENRPYRVREFVEGRPASILFTDGPLSEERLITTGRALASTLEALHRRAVVHTEVHPHGLRVESSDLIRFIDAGRAWPAQRPLPKLDRRLAEPYRAPEYKEGSPARCESDIFSLGAVLIAFALGKPPTDDGVNFKQLRERKEPLCPAFRVLLRSMIDPDPSKRPQAQTVFDALTRIDQINALLKLKSWQPPSSALTFFGYHAYPLTGRTKEMRQLMLLWQKVVKGEGTSVTIAGPQGSGRRRLVEELRRAVVRLGGAAVRFASEADPEKPTLIINSVSHKGKDGVEKSYPWLSVNFANTDTVADQNLILLDAMEGEDCVQLAESYLAAPLNHNLEAHLKHIAPLLPGELLSKLDDWCEQGVLKPTRDSWRFEPHDAVEKPAATPARKKKGSESKEQLDSNEILGKLMDMWPTNLEQDQPVLAALKSFQSVLKCQRIDLYKLESGDFQHLASSRLEEQEINPELVEKARLYGDPVWDDESLLLPLRCGVTPSGMLAFEWSKDGTPEISPALLQTLFAATSPFALCLGQMKDGVLL